MEAHTIPVTLYVHFNTFTNNYFVATCDMSKSAPDRYVLLEKREISFALDIPDPFSLIALQVDQLRRQKEQILAEAHLRQAEIDDKIQQLLCIDHTPGDVNHIPF